MKEEFGQTVIEIMLAAAIFVIVGSGMVISVLQSYSANRLGGEFSVANQYAAEGIEATRSIKNQAFSNLVNTAATGVIKNASNVWQFSGSGNTLTHNSGDNYNRVIKVEATYRDANGNVVSSGAPGAVLDPDTKKITSTVTWNFNSVRSEVISLISYLTDWRKALTSSGVLIYSDSVNLPTTPKYRTFTNPATMGAEAGTVAGAAVGATFKIKTSPTKQEAIAGYVDASNNLQVMCFNGTTWSNEWSVGVGGVSTQRFGLAYESQSGDVVVSYSKNVAAVNAISFRTKPGSLGCGSANWTAATNLPTSTTITSGTVQWIKMQYDPRPTSNIIGMIWADSNSDLGVALYDGTSWNTSSMKNLETALKFINSAQDMDNFDLAFESLSGNLMVVWGSGGSASVNGAWWNRCVGGVAGCSWNGSRTAITNMANDALDLDITSNPNTNELVFASTGSGTNPDLQAAYWSGSAWSGSNDIDTTTQTLSAGMKVLATGWLISGSTTKSVVLFENNGTSPNIYGAVGTNGSFVRQGTDPAAWFTPSPAAGGNHRWYDVQMDPFNKDSLIFTFSDSVSDLWSKKITMSSSGTFSMTNLEGGAALETNLGQAIAGPFGFAFWRNP